MRFLVIGCGSIGRRHAKNLLALGHTVIAIDVSPDGRRRMENDLGAKTFASLSSALSQKPSAALICTPPATHIALAKKALFAGCHVFIEKPVSDRLQGVDSIAALARKKKKIAQVGYNLRFVPGLAKLKEALQSGKYGKPLSGRAIFAQYLPYWRPGTDYRKGYTGKRKFGGGIILEASHELDYICWLLGSPKKLSCFARRVSWLEVDTEDNADVLLEFRSGATANVHLDFVRQDYRRGCEIMCEKGTLIWNLDWKSGRNTLEARSFNPLHPEKINSEMLLDVPWDTNDMYVAELEAFISAVKGGKRIGAGIEDGKLALKIALAALDSSKKGKAVKL